MTGSNKQIMWAKEIKANLIKTYRAVMPMLPEHDRPMLERAIAKLDSIDRAGIIIEAYKGIRFSGDPMMDISKIMACHSNMMPGELRQFVPEMHDDAAGL